MGYYNEKTLARFASALNEASEIVKAGGGVVSISNGNSKMGAVASVSTLPLLTCPGRCADTCGGKCYAAKIANLYGNVRASYAINTALALYAPDRFWAGVDMACRAVRFFRFHVSGDILNADYFSRMIAVARSNPKTEMLCFTKRYEVVNAWIAENGALPENLHILFSGWSNLTPDNPNRLPETTVFSSEGEISERWKVCGGNCFDCACRGIGCWEAREGETVAFKLH